MPLDDESRTEIRSLIGDALKGLTTPPPADPPPAGRGRTKGGDTEEAIAAQVAAAVQKVEADKAATAAEKAREERLKKVEDAQAAAEKEPRTYRRITEFLWGTPDDE